MIDVAKLEHDIQEQMQAGKVPGLALAVFNDREVLYANGFGVTSLEDSGVPVTAQTLFRIGSTTKPLTGTAIMRLVERGQLELDQPITRYVPTLEDTLPNSARITLRMLLSHSAGFADLEELFGERSPHALAVWVREQITEKLIVAEPGKVFSYSSPSLDLAGYVAEVVSGTAYSELMRELIFEPLAMTRTTFDPLVAMTYPVALGHDLLEDGSVRVQHRFAENAGQYPSSFAMSTALDLANFGSMHLSGGSFGGAQILSAESIAEMQRRQVASYLPSGNGYGLTFATETYQGVRRVKHGGMIGSFGSLFVLVPEQRLGFVALYNLTDLLSLNDLEAYLFNSLMTLPAEFDKPMPIEPDRSLWERYTGVYRKGDRTVQVVPHDEALHVQVSSHDLPLVAYREDCYYNAEYGLCVGFVQELSEPVKYLVFDGDILVRATPDAG
jgi:CubicO group peptidase (beta-lactamase class C family)